LVAEAIQDGTNADWTKGRYIPGEGKKLRVI